MNDQQERSRKIRWIPREYYCRWAPKENAKTTPTPRRESIDGSPDGVLHVEEKIIPNKLFLSRIWALLVPLHQSRDSANDVGRRGGSSNETLVFV